MAQTEPVIANYDDQTAEEIKQRLRKLSQADLAKLEAYEKQGQARSTVLEAIAALRGDEPWSGYDDMEVEDVNDALKQGDGELAGRVLDYERPHKGRTTIIEFAKRRQEANDGSAAATPGGERQSQTDTRSQPSKSSSRPKRAASKSSSASSRSASKSSSSSRSTRGRSPKAAPSRTRAKTPSRPSARSSGSQQTKRPQSSRPRSQPSSASQSRKPSRTRSSQSESRAKEALQAVAAKLKERATEALKSAEGPTKKLAKDTGHAVGSAAQAAPTKIRDRATEAMHTAEGPTKKRARDTGTAVRGTGQAVAEAANKAKTPALVGAATLATVGGVIALGSKVKPRKTKRVLGVPVPRRTAVGKAATRVGKTVDSVSSTGQQIGRWSDDLQYLRQRIGGGDVAVETLTGRGSADSEVLEDKPGVGRKVTPRGVARRILC